MHAIVGAVAALAVAGLLLLLAVDSRAAACPSHPGCHGKPAYKAKAVKTHPGYGWRR